MERRVPHLWLLAVTIAATLAIIGIYLPSAQFLHYAFKPVTTLVILAMVWRVRPVQWRYRLAIAIGLVLSTAGDIWLMLPGDWFVFGLASFLCAHIAYLVAFTCEVRLAARLWPFLAYIGLASGGLVVLWPRLPDALQIPVVVYVAVLTAMAAQAAVRWLALAGVDTRLAAIGALSFVVSDSLLAFDRFHTALPAGRLYVLATYWLAQALIGLSVVMVTRSAGR